MVINKFGEVSITEQEAIDAVYSGQLFDFKGINFVDVDVVKKFNRSVAVNADKFSKIKTLEFFDKSIELFDKANQCEWFMPDDYCPNLLEYLYGCCTTDDQRDRVSLELELFIEHGMFDLLFYLKFLVDTMRENNIVWGVGRGSSVASYVLYLIGVHKIDSLKFSLDIREFLK